MIAFAAFPEGIAKAVENLEQRMVRERMVNSLDEGDCLLRLYQQHIKVSDYDNPIGSTYEKALGDHVERRMRGIDAEVRRIVTTGEKKAWEILSEHKVQLEAMAQALMEWETLSGEECNGIMRGEKIVRRNDDDGSRGPAGSAVPTAGRQARPRGEPSGGMEPQPQS